MRKGYYDHARLGRLTLTLSPRARNITARWKGGRLLVTAPAMMSMHEIDRSLSSIADKILAIKPKDNYFAPGQRLDFDLFFIEIAESYTPNTISLQTFKDADGREGYRLFIDSSIDLSAPSAHGSLTNYMRRIAARYAPHLYSEAQQVAARIGVSPAEWKIGTGVKRMGCCSSKRVITLSYMCVFLPWRLREYIICHELAHLTHFDHSRAFHDLCSRYCGGDGDKRRAELKSFQWPIPR